MIDVTDATFEEEVLRRSSEVPVVVDLWAPWCGPCRTLGPIIEKVVDATEGAVALAKVNVDENPAISGSFQVQSIPAVFALKDGKVVDGFIGALPEAAVAEFVAKLAPAPSEADLLVAEGLRGRDRGAAAPGARAAARSRRGHRGPGRPADRPGQTPRRPSPCSAASPRRRRSAACWPRPAWRHSRWTSAAGRGRRAAGRAPRAGPDDPAARQEFLDLLETLGPDDPRTTGLPKGAGRPPVLTLEAGTSGPTRAGAGRVDRGIASRRASDPPDPRRADLRHQPTGRS